MKDLISGLDRVSWLFKCHILKIRGQKLKARVGWKVWTTGFNSWTSDAVQYLNTPHLIPVTSLNPFNISSLILWRAAFLSSYQRT